MMKKTRAATLVAAILLPVLCLGAKNPFTSGSKKELLNRLEALEKQNADLRQQVAVPPEPAQSAEVAPR